MNPTQPPENQMPGQPPFGAPPATMPASSTFDAARATLTTLQNRPYLIVAIGGLVGLISYLFLPFWGWSDTGATVVLAYSGSYTAAGEPTGSVFLWLSSLGALVALAVAALLTRNIRVSPHLTPALGARIILGSGVVALLCQIIAMLQINGSGSGSLPAQASAAGVSSGYSIGFWLMLLSFIAIIVGGVMNLRQTQAASVPGATR